MSYQITKLDSKSKTLGINFFNNLFKPSVQFHSANSSEDVKDDVINVFPSIKHFNNFIINELNCFAITNDFTGLLLNHSGFLINACYAVERKEFMNLKVKFNNLDAQTIMSCWFAQIFYYVTLGFETIESLINSNQWDQLRADGNYLIKEWDSSFIMDSLLTRDDKFRIILQFDNSSLVNSINLIDYCIFKLISEHRNKLIKSIINFTKWGNFDHLILWNSQSNELMLDNCIENRMLALSLKQGLLLMNRNDSEVIPNVIISKAWLTVQQFEMEIEEIDHKEQTEFIKIDRLTYLKKSDRMIINPIILTSQEYEFVINPFILIPKKYQYFAYGDTFKCEFVKNWIICSLITMMVDPGRSIVDNEMFASIVKHISIKTTKLNLSDKLQFDFMNEFMSFDAFWFDHSSNDLFIKTNDFIKLKGGMINNIYDGEGIQLFDVQWKSTLLARCIIACLEHGLKINVPKLNFHYGDNCIGCEDEDKFHELFTKNYQSVWKLIHVEDGPSLTVDQIPISIMTLRLKD